MKVNIKPISVNKIFQGRRFKTAEYKSWREECLYLIKQMKLKKIKGSCSVQLVFHCSKNFKIADIDNLCKGAIDSLVDSGVIEDDRYIEELFVHKVKDVTDFWEFNVKKL